jgi:hypothetical protein
MGRAKFCCCCKRERERWRYNLPRVARPRPHYDGEDSDPYADEDADDGYSGLISIGRGLNSRASNAARKEMKI